MPIPKNYVPFATSAISSDTRGVNSDRSDKLFEIKQDASNNRSVPYAIGIVVSGMSVASPNLKGLAVGLNAPEIIEGPYGEKQWKVRVKIISDQIFKRSQATISDFFEDIFSSTNELQSQIDMKDYPIAKSSTIVNWVPIFGTQVLLEEVDRNVYYIRRVLKDVAVDFSYYQAAASLFNLPWESSIQMGPNLGQAMVTNASTPRSLAAGLPPYTGQPFIKYPIVTKNNYVSVTSPFGVRLHPIRRTWGNHTGIDYGVKVGDPILAASDGEVTKITGTATSTSGYGLRVTLRHENGYVTTYSHLSDTFVQVGQKVTRGSKIAAGGSSGGSTGPHLHYEIKYNGKFIDPTAHPALILLEGQNDPQDKIEAKMAKAEKGYAEHLAAE